MVKTSPLVSLHNDPKVKETSPLSFLPLRCIHPDHRGLNHPYYHSLALRICLNNTTAEVRADAKIVGILVSFLFYICLFDGTKACFPPFARTSWTTQPVILPFLKSRPDFVHGRDSKWSPPKRASSWLYICVCISKAVSERILHRSAWNLAHVCNISPLHAEPGRMMRKWSLDIENREKPLKLQMKNNRN